VPFNLLKKYPELLDIGSMDEKSRTNSLRSIFKRDIEDHPNFNFRNKKIWPIKGEQIPMETLFHHLTTEEKSVEETGREYKKRVFEMDRSRRLHWIKFQIEESKKSSMRYFSVQERIKGRDVERTYIHDIDEKYVIVLEPQRTEGNYYLLTAFYLNRPEGEKSVEKKYKKRLADVL